MATTESELVFSPQANHNFSRILTDLKRSNLSISNRLRSIREDAVFVEEVADAFGVRPLVANERCGSWYIDPALKGGSAYFKSTDGHTGQWNFSLRRLNLHLLPLIAEHDGCIIVDSTRRGKQMPDALSKTVPIWCCVLNRVLFPDHDDDDDNPAGEGGGMGCECEHHMLYTPPNVVSRSEHAQAEARIPAHVAALKALDIDIAALRRQISKPLRPIWITPDSHLAPTDLVFDRFHPVVCCTSSRRVPGGEMSEGGYIQGAGDDTENWALGLTAPLFWANAEVLLSTPEPGLPDLVRSLVANKHRLEDGDAEKPVQVGPGIFVGRLPITAASAANGAIAAQDRPGWGTIAFVPETTDRDSWLRSPFYMAVGIGKQVKIASRNLRTALPAICDFAQSHLRERYRQQEERRERKENCHDGKKEEGDGEEERNLLITCETGKDLSVGVALAVLCQFFDEAGNYNQPKPKDLCAPGEGVNKRIIKTKLGRIMMAFPEANPSRATLQSVNSYLMG
ncbi:initiator tRNA phosphoribosyl transferase [Xylariaceae sp. FL0594]|nr:initiator tRNA phosphoribosyl transferase [Xylariaceae sp. FL0594]